MEFLFINFEEFLHGRGQKMAFKADGLPFQENGFHSCGCKAFNGRNLILLILYKESLPFSPLRKRGGLFPHSRYIFTGKNKRPAIISDPDLILSITNN